MNPRYSVGQIAAYIKSMFDRDFVLRGLSVEGELSNVKYHTNGHIYFTLKDEKAALNGIMFKGQRSNLKIRLYDGMKVTVSGNISSYPLGSVYQIYATGIEESGLGDLYREFIRRKNALEAEGLFDAAHKKPIPAYASKIGVVTASTGAAIQDIINITRRRNPYVRLILCPALVQGNAAAASIVRGIETLDRLGLDTIIIGRGGGSLEDLWAFNEEAVVRAVYAAETPIISAVGHETDISLSDYAADMRAPTPSAAAELAVYDICDFRERLQTVSKLLKSQMRKSVDDQKRKLEQSLARLNAQNPRRRLQEMRTHVLYTSDKLDSLMKQRLLQSRQELKLRAARLQGLSPLNKLGNGYAFVESSAHEPLRSVDQAECGASLTLYLKDGYLETTVREIHHGNTGC